MIAGTFYTVEGTIRFHRQIHTTFMASDNELLISEHCPSEEVYLIVLGASKQWQAEACTYPTVHQQDQLNPI